MNKIFALNKLLSKIASPSITLDETPIQKYVNELFENQIDDAEEESSLDDLIQIYPEIKELNFNDPDIGSMIFDIVRKTRNHKGLDLFFKWDHHRTNKEHEKVFGKRTLQDIQKEKNDFLEKMIKKALDVKDFIQKKSEEISSPIRIVPQIEEEYIVDLENAITSYQVFVGGLSFSVSFEENKVDIDDVFEDISDFAEYFPDEKNPDAVIQDYFVLIDNLKNLSPKWLTLFTARPTKDRQLYYSATALPKGIFLSNSFSHVYGLSHDLGSNEIRDVWKVRVSSKDVIKTLDGDIKYFMTTREAPLKTSPILVEEGT